MTKEKMVRAVAELSDSVAEASAGHAGPTLPENRLSPMSEITRRQRQNCRRIEMGMSRYKVKSARELSEDEKRFRDYMWEYVEGVFERQDESLEPLRFWHNPFPGDDYAEWSVPAGVAISIPRWMAKHLNERKYKTFKYAPRPSADLQVGEHLEGFVPDKIKHRMSFNVLGAY